MIYFLLLTALTVSIDSFICGFSLSLIKAKKIHIVLGITFIVFIMCLLTNYLAMFFSQYINEKASAIGGVLLIGVGLFNLLKKEEENNFTDKNAFKQIAITGFAVGIDGAIANLSLSLMNINAFYVPVIIAIMHGLMIFLGVTLPAIPLVRGLTKYSFIAPIILILLGIYKVIGVFI